MTATPTDKKTMKHFVYYRFERSDGSLPTSALQSVEFEGSTISVLHVKRAILLQSEPSLEASCHFDYLLIHAMTDTGYPSDETSIIRESVLRVRKVYRTPETSLYQKLKAGRMESWCGTRQGLHQPSVAVDSKEKKKTQDEEEEHETVSRLQQLLLQPLIVQRLIASPEPPPIEKGRSTRRSALQPIVEMTPPPPLSKPSENPNSSLFMSVVTMPSPREKEKDMEEEEEKEEEKKKAMLEPISPTSLLNEYFPFCHSYSFPWSSSDLLTSSSSPRPLRLFSEGCVGCGKKDKSLRILKCCWRAVCTTCRPSDSPRSLSSIRCCYCREWITPPFLH